MDPSVTNNIRIFIGPAEMANIAAMLASALKKTGVHVTVVCLTLRPYQYGMEYDNVLDFKGLREKKGIFRHPSRILEFILRHLYYLRYFLQHNSFIFLAGYSLLPFNLDLPLYKLFRKKTIMWFVGSDIRDYTSVEIEVKRLGIKHRMSEGQRDTPRKLKQKKRMIYLTEKYVDNIIAYPSIAQLLTRDYVGKERIDRIYCPIYTENIVFNNIPNPVPLLVHAPSNDESKGTSYILKAVNQLKDEGYDFEFVLIRNTSNVEVRNILSKADIAIDQLFSPEPGMFALESMSAGCAVLSGNIPEFANLPEELPIIHSDPDNVYQNLKLLLNKPELRRELGEKGRQYVKKYHDPSKIASQILGLLQNRSS